MNKKPFIKFFVSLGLVLMAVLIYRLTPLFDGDMVMTAGVVVGAVIVGGIAIYLKISSSSPSKRAGPGRTGSFSLSGGGNGQADDLVTDYDAVLKAEHATQPHKYIRHLALLMSGHVDEVRQVISRQGTDPWDPESAAAVEVELAEAQITLQRLATALNVDLPSACARLRDKRSPLLATGSQHEQGAPKTSDGPSA